jgi:sugar phosphate permease
MSTPGDPVLARRQRVDRLATSARRLGWALFGIAVVAFILGLVIGLTAFFVVVVMTALVVGSLLLAPAIIIGFGVTAAERDDRTRS